MLLGYVELTEAGIEALTFRLQGEHSTDRANRPLSLIQNKRSMVRVQVIEPFENCGLTAGDLI